ncbi:hypothetical protein SLH49_11700 [Cognatiyoonia sp. IB215446]|uniref:hypothetical protein n=1 Tax=Cognatiyoonia sp. IB215446 TaxID=3097355 RepID=UPI002A0EE1DB|nr:hypothetical protein [Cognatiyoonia sp. IB215446]MDX8348644.1 hypothetical protein [Cognatiyoonia sp. IB215446]
MTSRLQMYGLAMTPLFFYAAIELLTFRLNNPVISGLAPKFDDSSAYYENATRYTLQAAVVFLFWVAVGAVGLLMRDILAKVGISGLLRRSTAQDLGPKHARMDLAFFLFYVGFAIYASTWFGSIAGENRNFQNLGTGLFVEVMNHCHVVLNQPQSCVFGEYRPALPPSGLGTYLNLTTFVTIVGLVASALGCCRAVMLTDAEVSRHPGRDIFRGPRLYLYVSSTLFTAATLCIYGWSGWPVPFLDGADLTAYRSLQNGLALFWATSFSLIVLTFYLPVMLALYARIADQPNPDAGSEGKPQSVVKIVDSALAILVPVIAALLSHAGASFVDAL